MRLPPSLPPSRSPALKSAAAHGAQHVATATPPAGPLRDQQHAVVAPGPAADGAVAALAMFLDPARAVSPLGESARVGFLAAVDHPSRDSTAPFQHWMDAHLPDFVARRWSPAEARAAAKAVHSWLPSPSTPQAADRVRTLTARLESFARKLTDLTLALAFPDPRRSHCHTELRVGAGGTASPLSLVPWSTAAERDSMAADLSTVAPFATGLMREELTAMQALITLSRDVEGWRALPANEVHARVTEEVAAHAALPRSEVRRRIEVLARGDAGSWGAAGVRVAKALLAEQIGDAPVDLRRDLDASELRADIEQLRADRREPPDATRPKLVDPNVIGLWRAVSTACAGKSPEQREGWMRKNLEDLVPESSLTDLSAATVYELVRVFDALDYTGRPAAKAAEIAKRTNRMTRAANNPASDATAIARELLNLCGAGGVLSDAAASMTGEALASADRALAKFAAESHLPPAGAAGVAEARAALARVRPIRDSEGPARAR